MRPFPREPASAFKGCPCSWHSWSIKLGLSCPTVETLSRDEGSTYFLSIPIPANECLRRGSPPRGASSNRRGSRFFTMPHAVASLGVPHSLFASSFRSRTLPGPTLNYHVYTHAQQPLSAIQVLQRPPPHLQPVHIYYGLSSVSLLDSSL